VQRQCNPDLYLADMRVDMVSSPEAFAEQVPGLSAEAVRAVPLYAGFLTAPDRIEYWLRHEAPPGDSAAAAAARIVAFAISLGDQGRCGPDTVVAVSHSPMLWAVSLCLTGEDLGEPPHLTGFAVDAGPGGSPRALAFDPFPDRLQALPWPFARATSTTRTAGPAIA
jgi:hypothetical protein